MHNLNYIASSELVESYAKDLYDELNKITDVCEPSLFENLFKLIAEILQDFDNCLTEQKSLKELLNLLEADKQELENLFKEERQAKLKKDSTILKLTDENEILKFDPSIKIWENKLNALEKEKREVEKLLLQEKTQLRKVIDDGKLLDKKHQSLEHLYADLMLDHKNLIEATRLLEEDIKLLSKNNEKITKVPSDGSFSTVLKKGKFQNLKCLSQYPPLTNSTKTSNRYEPLTYITVTDNPNDNQDHNNHSQKLLKPRELPKTRKQPLVNSNLTPNKKQLNSQTLKVIGDSHGRNLARILHTWGGDGYRVNGKTEPNANVPQLINEIRKVGNDNTDYLILAVGANDAYTGQCPRTTFNELVKILENLTLPIIMLSIPFRRDIPFEHPINENIMNYNLFLSDLSQQKKNYVFIDISVIPENLMSKDGVHLNQKGKAFACKEILRKINDGTTCSGRVSKSCQGELTIDNRRSQTNLLHKKLSHLPNKGDIGGSSQTSSKKTETNIPVSNKRFSSQNHPKKTDSQHRRNQPNLLHKKLKHKPCTADADNVSQSSSKNIETDNHTPLNPNFEGEHDNYHFKNSDTNFNGSITVTNQLEEIQLGGGQLQDCSLIANQPTTHVLTSATCTTSADILIHRPAPISQDLTPDRGSTANPKNQPIEWTKQTQREEDDEPSLPGTPDPEESSTITTPGWVPPDEPHFKGFDTPDRQQLQKLQELVDKCLGVSKNNVDKQNKNNYFLRKRKNKSKKS